MGLFDKVKKIFNTDEEENDNNLLNNQTSIPEKEEPQLLEPNGYNFTYLDSLIYGGESYIKLDYDVILTDDELDYFPEGIYIGIDNITIDGNGHTIDAQEKTRIFNVQANNITLNNIILQNAYVEGDNGGAISLQSDSSLKIEDTTFRHNKSRSGGAVHSFGDLIISNSHFSDNTSLFDGGAIMAWGKFRLKESRLINNHASNYGGAIFNMAKSIIDDCTISGNHAKCGGAIETWKPLTISNTLIENNNASEGCAIKNFESLTISNSKIHLNNKDNISIIHNDSGIIKIYQSEISKNKSKENIIYNNDTLVVTDSSILNNKSENTILNESKLSFSGDKLLNNYANNAVIVNNKEGTIIKTIFENDKINIRNKGNLMLQNCRIDMDTIINDGSLSIPDQSAGDEISVENESLGFAYLEDLIIGNPHKNIKLENDYLLSEYERDYYEGGIELDMDNLVIDGQNHIIDGNHLSRIFIITGKNVTLKNITFRNGYTAHSHDNSLNNYGGSIRNNSESNSNILNCKFTDNLSEVAGGAIDNKGKLIIKDSTLSNNTAGGKDFGGGGAIYNSKSLVINDCILTNNTFTSERTFVGGGAVFNHFGEVEIFNSEFNQNSTNQFGGVINNHRGNMNITRSIFSKNNVDSNYWSDGGGGVIYNMENTITFNECKLQDNTADNGGAIINWGTMIIEKSEISDNTARKTAGSISNVGKQFVIKNSLIKNNTSNEKNVSITNDSEGVITISDSTIEEYSRNIDYIIDTNDENNVMLENCLIK